MAAYQPTNTVILTESASNIRRLIQILESIDVESYKEDLAVINVEYADAGTLADQISEIYGAEVAETPGGAFESRRAARRRVANPQEPNAGPTSVKPPVRILTDERTNSLLVLAPRAQLEEVRRLVAKLDVPVPGGGRIHVYYLNNAKAEELAETLSSLVGGGGGGGGRSSSSGSSSRSSRSSRRSSTTTTPGGATVPATSSLGGGAGITPSIRSEVAGLEGGISVTADAATNSLIIQASMEGFNTLASVIKKLDVVRPQVSVEALIMELTVSDNLGIGFNGLIKAIDGNQAVTLASAASAAANANGIPTDPSVFAPLFGRIFKDTRSVDPTTGERVGDGTLIDSIITLSASNGDINIVSAPHILTSDNEEAEIRVGNNIPIISSRVQSAAGIETAGSLASSVNVERQDIGVTLRVTPQITEGDSLRLEIFQEITEINNSLSTSKSGG